MDRYKNYNDTINHVQPDDIIIDLGGNPLSGMEGQTMNKMLDFLGFDRDGGNERKTPFGKTDGIDERILKYFDIDTSTVGRILRPKDSQQRMLSNDMYIDEWGITRKYVGQYWDIFEYPLKGATVYDLETYEWPNPKSISIKEIEEIQAQARDLNENTDYIICAQHPVYGIFELGCWMCGFDDFLMKMIIDKDFVRMFFDKILYYQKKVIDLYYPMVGPYSHYTSSGDDFATQNSLFMSPELFKEMIQPYFTERISYTKKFTDAAFLHHSCGSVYKIIENLIDCGVEMLNPIQPEAANMQPETIKSEFGDRIVFHGGLGTQDVLLRGSRESIQENVKKTISVMNENGGYVFAAAHNIQDDIPSQNIAYMFEAARKYGKKRT